MFKTLSKLSKLENFIFSTKTKVYRTFLSPSYYCQELWDKRLNSPLLQKVNLEELYQELEQRFSKLRQMSAVDVDIYANAVKDNFYVEEMLDLVHKLRLSADTGNTLNSTSHAVVRVLTRYGNKKDLLSVLDDRINYGIFLDYYTANILLDIFWKEKDYTSGARVASQLMLQEEFENPISFHLSLLHCYNYLLNPGEWTFPPPPEEPEEEVKIRVNYLRNPFHDDHFDLREPEKLVGKTFALFTNNKIDSLNKSFNIFGWALFGKNNKVEKSIKECHEKNIILCKEVLDLIPETCEMKSKLLDLICESIDIQKVLKENVEKAVSKISEDDISTQCKLFSLWDEERIAALEEQKRRLLVKKRLAHIEQLKNALEEKETKLWFFDNEEQIELQIEAKEEEDKAQIKETKKSTEDSDENYVPPEVWSKQTN